MCESVRVSARERGREREYVCVNKEEKRREGEEEERSVCEEVQGDVE